MKNVLLLLITLLLSGCSEEQRSSSEKTDRFTIGGETIAVPVPQGFIPVTPDLNVIYEFYATVQEHVFKSSNGLIKPLKHYVILQDIQQEKDMTHNCYVAHNPAANEMFGKHRLTEEQFKKIIEPIKQPNMRKAIFGQAGKMANANIDSFNQEAVKRFGEDMALTEIKLSDDDFLIIDDQNNAFVWVMPMSVSDTQSTLDTLVSNAILNVKGRIIYAYCYASSNELKWLRDISLDWNKRLFEANR